MNTYTTKFREHLIPIMDGIMAAINRRMDALVTPTNFKQGVELQFHVTFTQPDQRMKALLKAARR